ncbi:hypothetical protein GMJAKD_13595 [Candidatus Electrothrix aarhusensis]
MKAVLNQNPSAIRATQLAVIAALIDGKATDDEIELASTEVGREYDAPAEEVKKLALRLLKAHQAIDLPNNPVAAIRRGQLAMRGMADEEIGKIQQIVRRVISADGQETATEQSFLNMLSNHIKRPIPTC